MTTAGFDQIGPTPDPRWQAALDRIAPRTDRGYDWLLLRWEPGDPWAPVERWIIWNMTPVDRIPEGFGILEALEGPNPRNFGHYSEAEGRFIRSRRLPINRQQWELYREFGRWASPLWIVQGKNGGNLRRWTEVQSTVSQLHGGPAAPPYPGELPYAPFDDRVIDRLKALDLVDRYGDILRNFAEKPWLVEWLDRREREGALDLARQLWDWLGLQVEEVMNPGEGDGLTRDHLAAIRESADPTMDEPDEELIEKNFMETVITSYGG